MDEKKPPREPAGKEKESEGGKKPAAAPQEGQPKAPKSNKTFILGLVGGIIAVEVVLGLVAVKMITAKYSVDPQSEAVADSLARSEKERTTMGSTTAEAPIEVLANIAGTDGERVVKAAIVMEYEEKTEKKAGGEGKGGSPLGEAIAQRMPKFKNFLIDRLSRMTMAEITAADAKERLRKDFLSMVNGTLPPKLGEVKDVYFTQFIIQ
jgi:flagellar basal body-associated protein FliL